MRNEKFRHFYFFGPPLTFDGSEGKPQILMFTGEGEKKFGVPLEVLEVLG